MLKLIKQFFFLLDVEAKRKLPLLLIGFLCLSFLDVVGISLIGFYLQILTKNSSYILNLHWNFLYALRHFSQIKLISIFGLFILIALMLKGLSVLIIQRQVVSFSQSLKLRLSLRMLKAYQAAPYSYHLENNSVISITRIGQITTFIYNVLTPVVNLVSIGCIGVAIFLSLLIIVPVATVVLLGIFFSLATTQYLLIKKRLKKAGEEILLHTGTSMKILQHSLTGIREIRILGKENYFQDQFNHSGLRTKYATMDVISWQEFPRQLIENSIALFIVGFSLVCIIKGYTLSTVVAIVGMFVVAGIRLLPIVSQMISNVNTLCAYHLTIRLLYDDLTELQSLENKATKETQVSENKNLNFQSLDLKNISFTYPNRKFSALEKINMQIKKGESVGIIGSSGAGKSTLINVILGFLTPQSGKILINNKPFVDLPAWFSSIAYIPQIVFMMDDTLKRNIALGIKDEDINEQRLREVIKLVQLEALVEELPDNINTIIGENSVRLSGGQRQRIAIARALYFEREIIILDEAFSALDYKTEREIITSMQRLKGNKTFIIITHRLSMINFCDKVYKIDQGKIVAAGSYTEVVDEAAEYI